MGHYASEMHLSAEPVKEDKWDGFVVNDNFEVQTIEDFIHSHRNYIDINLYLAFQKRFAKREDAELHARKECEEAVEHARKRLAVLKKICKVTRPWDSSEHLLHVRPALWAW